MDYEASQPSTASINCKRKRDNQEAGSGAEPAEVSQGAVVSLKLSGVMVVKITQEPLADQLTFKGKPFHRPHRICPWDEDCLDACWLKPSCRNGEEFALGDVLVFFTDMINRGQQLPTAAARYIRETYTMSEFFSRICDDESSLPIKLDSSGTYVMIDDSTDE